MQAFWLLKRKSWFQLNAETEGKTETTNQSQIYPTCKLFDELSMNGDRHAKSHPLNHFDSLRGML